MASNSGDVPCECASALNEHPDEWHAGHCPRRVRYDANPDTSAGAVFMPQPDGYAYRYPDGCIRHNGGEQVNLMRPIEALPWVYVSTVAALSAELERVKAERDAAMKREADGTAAFACQTDTGQPADLTNGLAVLRQIATGQVFPLRPGEATALLAERDAALKREADGLAAWKANNATLVQLLRDVHESWLATGGNLSADVLARLKEATRE